jgi:hypothetical protein
LTAAALLGESTLLSKSARDCVRDGDVGEYQLDILRDYEAILIEIVSKVKGLQDMASTYKSKVNLIFVSKLL